MINLQLYRVLVKTKGENLVGYFHIHLKNNRIEHEGCKGRNELTNFTPLESKIDISYLWVVQLKNDKGF